MLAGPHSTPTIISSSSLLHGLIPCLLLLTLVVSCVGRLHNFASLDVLSDGEVERYIHYRGLTVKETQINSSDNRESLLLRQMTDGTTFIQLIYSNNSIKDCEHLKSKTLIRQFLRSFRNSIHARRNSSPIVSLDGQPLPPYYASWYSMHKLKHRCNKLHKAIKKMTKRVPNIYDNLIDMPDQHYDWKDVNSKHKPLHGHMRQNTTVPKYLIKLPSTTSKMDLTKNMDSSKTLMKNVNRTGVISKIPISHQNKSKSTSFGADTAKRKQLSEHNMESISTTSHRESINLTRSNNKHSNQTERCNRKRKSQKCPKKLHSKENSSDKNLVKGQNNEIVANEVAKFPHELHHKTMIEGSSTLENPYVVPTTAEKTIVVKTKNANENINVHNVKNSLNYTIKTKGKNVFLNVNKPTEHIHQTKIPQHSTADKTVFTAIVSTTERVDTRQNTVPDNNVTTSIENIKIRHHHKQNRHFKKKKRKKNGKKKLNNNTKNVNKNSVNNEPTAPSSESNVDLSSAKHVHSNDSQLESGTPVTNAMNATYQSETVTSRAIGLRNTTSNVTRITTIDININVTKTDSDSFDDLKEESSQHKEQVNVINVNRIRDDSNKTRIEQESMHVYRNLTAEESMSALERLKLGFSSLMLVPGTKWCGYGNGATDFTDLGSFSGTDLCCRRHDSCRLTIPGFGRKWGYFNFKPFTLSYCGCDHRFRTCLKLADSGSANLVGKLFFNIVQTKCFVLRAQKSCTRRSWWGKCVAHEASHRAEIRDNHPY